MAALATRAFIGLTRWLPLPLCRALALLGGRSLAPLVPRVRRVTMYNLDLAYGDTRAPAEKRRIYHQIIDNLCLVAAEFSRTDQLARAGEVIVEGADHIKPDQGYLCIGAHLGNWELMGPAMVAQGFKVAAVVRPFDDPGVNEIIDRQRTIMGIRTITKDNAGPDILKCLREGYLVGILIDQSPRENGVPVTSFGHPCWATIAPAMIAVRSRVPIVPVALTRRDEGGYRLRFYPPLEMARTGDLRRDLQDYAQACQDAIDTMIQDNPGQWLWLHRRWKERPRLAAEWERKQARDKKETEA